MTPQDIVRGSHCRRLKNGFGGFSGLAGVYLPVNGTMRLRIADLRRLSSAPGPVLVCVTVFTEYWDLIDDRSVQLLLTEKLHQEPFDATPYCENGIG